MANTVKKRDKVPATTPKRKQRMVCLMSEEEVRIVDAYLKKYKISNKARWLRETVLTFIHQKNDIAVGDFEFSLGSSFKFIDGGGNDGIFFLFQKSNQTLSGFCVSRI